MSASQCMWLLSPPRWAAAQSFLLTFHQSSTHVLQRSCFHSFVSAASHTRNRWRKKKKNAVQSFLFICNIDPLMRCLKGFKDRQTWCDRNRSDHQSCFHLYTTFNHFKVKCRRRSDSYVPGNKVSRADWLTGWLIVSPQHLSALMRLVIH